VGSTKRDQVAFRDSGELLREIRLLVDIVGSTKRDLVTHYNGEY